MIGETPIEVWLLAICGVAWMWFVGNVKIPVKTESPFDSFMLFVFRMVLGLGGIALIIYFYHGGVAPR